VADYMAKPGLVPANNQQHKVAALLAQGKNSLRLAAQRGRRRGAPRGGYGTCAPAACDSTEAGSAGEQPAEEYPAGTHCVAGREVYQKLCVRPFSENQWFCDAGDWRKGLSVARSNLGLAR